MLRIHPAPHDHPGANTPSVAVRLGYTKKVLARKMSKSDHRGTITAAVSPTAFHPGYRRGARAYQSKSAAMGTT
jgi:hypothetical protein